MVSFDMVVVARSFAAVFRENRALGKEHKKEEGERDSLASRHVVNVNIFRRLSKLEASRGKTGSFPGEDLQAGRWKSGFAGLTFKLSRNNIMSGFSTGS